MTRKAKIVATIGPASRNEEVLEKLILAGMNVARINFSHGTQEEHTACFSMIRKVSERLGISVGILQDLQGPKIRVGELTEPIQLSDGETVTLYTTGTAAPGNGEKKIPVDFRQLFDSVRTSDRLLLDDGRLALEVVSVKDRNALTAKVLVGGPLSSHKGINLPGVRLRIAGFTEKDEADLAFGVSQGVDAVAISFVRTAEDIKKVRYAMERFANGKRMPLLIAKPEASDVANAIFDGTDAVMLSAESASGKYPVESVQMMDRIVREAEKHFLEWGAQQSVTGFEHSDAASMARAAQSLANDQNVTAVACFTTRGQTAWLMSKIRPRVPIMAFTPNADTAHQLTFLWGVRPQVVPFVNSIEEMLEHVDAELMRSQVVQQGDQVVLVCGFPVGAVRPPNMALLHTVGDR